MKEVMIFEKHETLAESLTADLTTFGFLLLCIWFSGDRGGGWWTFFTCSMFLFSLAMKLPWGTKSRWVKLRTKREAIEWANSLPDDETPNAEVKGAPLAERPL